MTTLTTQPPTKEQLDRIRTLSKVVLGDPERLFDRLGEPDTRWEASQMLGALHKIRNQQAGGTFEERTLISQIEELPSGPPAEEEKPMPKAEGDTKTCSSCGEDKDLDQFGKVAANPDGLNYSCKQCIRDKDKARRGKKLKAELAQSPAERPPRPVEVEEHFALASDPPPVGRSLRESVSGTAEAVVAVPRRGDSR